MIGFRWGMSFGLAFGVGLSGLGGVAAAQEASEAAAKGRRKSERTPETVSRWSNRGAMEPIESEVPIAAPLPERAVPRPAGIETPGQRLRRATRSVFSARVRVTGYRWHTKGQDVRYVSGPASGDGVTALAQDGDIELLRARVSLGYDRIQESLFSAHLDGEFRPSFHRTRPSDYRLNELSLSYGLYDLRQRWGPDFGVSMGRVLVREAGFAQADGIAVRYRMWPGTGAGLFGGVTGNPLGYNWRLQRPESFSTRWLTGGGFGRFHRGPWSVSIGGVATYARLPATDRVDRAYGILQAAYSPDRRVRLSALARMDAVDGLQSFQTADLGAHVRFSPQLDLGVSAGRFSSIVYDAANPYSYVLDPLGNRFGANQADPIVDEQGVPILPYNGAFLKAAYYRLRLRSGVRPHPNLELYTDLRGYLRDRQYAQAQALLPPNEAPLTVSSLRFRPALGLRWRDPSGWQVGGWGARIFDGQAVNHSVAGLEAGFSFRWLSLRADGRAVLGDTSAWDGGAEAMVFLPRTMIPGTLSLHLAGRYFREGVQLERPLGVEQEGFVDAPDLVLIDPQESYLVYAGLQWRFR